MALTPRGFEDFTPVDYWRIAVAAAALWLAFLVLRMAWVRWRTPSERHRTHPATHVSFALLLGTVATRRVENIGLPPDAYLYVTSTAVILGLVGVLRRVRLSRGRRPGPTRPE